MAMPKSTEHCMVCGSTLEYFKTAKTVTCTYCAKSEAGHIQCSQGHYICDACHSKDAMKAIEDLASTTELKDPVEIAELMMSHPGLPMLGCEHAYVAAGALLAALRNSPYGNITTGQIREAFDRIGRQAAGGYCGLTGVCGIVPAVGACFSIFLGAHCGTDREQKITMEAVTKTAGAIADLTGPSCCKAYVRSAISVAVQEFGEKFGIVLPVKDASLVCRQSERHPHGCREEKCPYYKKEAAKDIFAESIHLPVTVCHT
ncbi:MAG: DUF5714 domain-containing protein [Nitrospirota bacterium]